MGEEKRKDNGGTAEWPIDAASVAFDGNVHEVESTGSVEAFSVGSVDAAAETAVGTAVETFTVGSIDAAAESASEAAGSIADAIAGLFG